MGSRGALPQHYSAVDALKDRNGLDLSGPWQNSRLTTAPRGAPCDLQGRRSRERKALETGDLLSTPKSGGSSACPTPGSGEAGSHRRFRLVPSGFVAPLKGAVSQTGGGDDAEGRGRAEAEVGWCSLGYGGRRGALGGHGLVGKWRRLGGRPCPCRRPGRGGAPSGLADAGECVSALSVLSTGLRAGGAGRAESGPGHARPARREPWS